MRTLGTVAVVVLVASTCFAQGYDITLQDYTLQANALSEISIPVSGGGLMWGMTMSIQIGDGQTGPAITDITFIEPGMVFSGDYDNPVATPGTDYGFPGFYQYDITTAVGSAGVAADGVLCKVTIDTAGFDTGEWTLTVENTMAGPTLIKDSNGDALPASFTDGRIIVPEPATMALLGFGAMGVLLRKRRAA